MTSSFRDSELAGWTARADSYDKLFTPISDQAIAPIVSKLDDVRGRRILDVCYGSGRLTAALARLGADVEGLDFAPTMVARASANFPGIKFRQDDAERLPYDQNMFDCTVCCFGVMHLERPEQAIAEAYRVLKRGGNTSSPSGPRMTIYWASSHRLLPSTAIERSSCRPRRRRCGSANLKNATAFLRRKDLKK
jgi:ubiquinone/menaquinone biosynthesis C-methylase UbiE